ncbi:MAG: F0F1 ATP synthase subunit A [Clostridia bacterium]|nr:F0F1 ATP synthase subunit A [Clostridia bacterium]
MTKKSRRFILTDILLIGMMVLPLVCGMVLKVIFEQPSLDGSIVVEGAMIYFTIPFPLQDIIISEAQINSWLVIITLFGLCLFLTHGVAAKPVTKRQLIAEWIVEQVDNMVLSNMGDYFKKFAPFIAGMMGLSALSSLLGLLGLFAPTSDINIVGGWAILVFFMITYYRAKCGPIGYVKSLAEPVAPLAILNVISEIATPISMAFRHYGNILAGVVISILVATGLQGVSETVLGWLPGVLGDIPFLQIGIPAILSLYFDLFGAGLQAFIFAMLTMMYISGAFAQDDYEKLQQKKQEKRRKKQWN